jgi:hypothetical protein
LVNDRLVHAEGTLSKAIRFFFLAVQGPDGSWSFSKQSRAPSMNIALLGFETEHAPNRI